MFKSLKSWVLQLTLAHASIVFDMCAHVINHGEQNVTFTFKVKVKVKIHGNQSNYFANIGHGDLILIITPFMSGHLDLHDQLQSHI